MSSNEKKRGSSPGTHHDKTPSKRSKAGSSSGGRPSKAANFVAAEDAALCKAYVNVTLNPIDGVGQKASAFWDHIHRKYCVLLKEDNPSEALPDRDSESLKNRFQRQIQKKMNVYNRYYKQVKECPPSRTTEEEWYKIAADNYRDAEGHSFPFKTAFASSIPSSQFEELDVGRHDILHEHLKAAPRKPEHQLELDTKQWCVTNVISFNAGKSLIMLKLPPIAPRQLTVIFLPLIALHHSSHYQLPTSGSSSYCFH
jgi:hypothetical protein